MKLTKLSAALNNLVGWARAGFNAHNTRIAAVEKNKPNIIFGNFAADTTEQNALMSTAPSQQDIFNSWYRFSHDNSLVFPAVPTEIDAWAYDAASSSISNTTNSGSFIGVVSKEVYDSYSLTMKLSSTNPDDDIIGVLLAWYKDPATGREYTISALRSPGGMSPLYAIVYNFNQGAPGGQKTLQDGNAKVTWGNGAAGNLTQAAAGYANNTPGWGGLAAQFGTDGSVRLHVERTGDIIKVKTTQFANPNALDDNTLLTIDLSTDPLLSKFRGATPYGMVAISQQDSKWAVTEFSNAKDGIYNMTTGEVWMNVNGVWSVSQDYSVAKLGKNVFMVNPKTGKMFAMLDSGTIVQYTGTLLAGTTPPPADTTTSGTGGTGGGGTGGDTTTQAN